MFSDDDWGVQSPPKFRVFRFHYHSQKVIGSLGFFEGPHVNSVSFWSSFHM